MKTDFVEYTVGMLYTEDFEWVLLLNKTKPNWQAGKYNFPGGKVEPGEPPRVGVSREFKEETGLKIPTFTWKSVGTIYNGDSGYRVLIFAGIYYPEQHGKAETLTDEVVRWHKVKDLPPNIITNLEWLVPLGKNYLQQGNNPDKINFVAIDYID